ncbi:hypothetical protein [Microbulbifer sp. YPW1]|uniref:hypothetical protein n=1 Tax=Microbulbifer sp. YPW1 TaxID=2745199 RepID=UPI001597B8F6|nr:hypothetical protein [Microbulbifer sp. YPW1]QKX17743.1 hypothetical protein HUW35_12595 [Microbulbifer sp. YPW1]
MQKESASVKETLSGIFSMIGGSVAALAPVQIWASGKSVLVIGIILALVATSVLLYAIENGYKVSLYFSICVAAYSAGFGFVVFIPLALFRVDYPIPTEVYLISILIGIVVIFAGYFIGQKFKLLNKALQADV